MKTIDTRRSAWLLQIAAFVSALATLTAAPSVTRAADRVTQSQGGGCSHSGDHPAVTVSDRTRVKSVTIIHGDRINGIDLHGADGSVASFRGNKGAPEPKGGFPSIEIKDGEHLVGFQGLCSDGRAGHAGWYKVRVVIDGPGGRRYSDEFGTGGRSNIHVFGDATVSIGMKRFEILAPEGHEVVGLVGSAGAVIDEAKLITQKR